MEITRLNHPIHLTLLIANHNLYFMLSGGGDSNLKPQTLICEGVLYQLPNVEMILVERNPSVIQDIMHRAKAKKKSKTKKSLEANAAKDLPSQVAWEGWFRPHQSSSQSPQEMNQPILARMPNYEDEETQDPTMSAEENHDDITPEIQKNKRRRGPNKEIPAPANPNERMLVNILHDEKFVDPKIVRTITKCIQLHFNDAWPTWKKVAEAIKDEMWAKFEGKFMCPIEKAKVVRAIWETTCKEWLCGMLEEERKRAMRHFGVSDISKCKGYNVGWIRMDIWDRLVSDVWTTDARKN
ncbi:uncharacterized protein LOC120272423 [Dioscorea cayenensis subsp. rotundata]|uniref:Uncharacterized protein LOC120272423 n=1 Tax=Dioscorea cayennensis subsp. rotundata TaxID=55577 RepID=A0AB40C6D7_DIOCR|nr:uncharacterized protein LOC120272423 [Dioscorea cayenensis subsp. rotundata]